MLVDRLDLEKTISAFITEYRPKPEIIDKIEEDLFQANIDFGMKLLTRQLPLQTQPTVILFLLSKFFYAHTHDNKIKPSKFFTKVEMEEFKDFKMEVEDKIKEVVFKEFTQGAEDIWTGYLDIKDIAKLWQRGVATYNKETQRNTILTKFQGSIIEEINLNASSVDEITQDLKDNKYIPITPIVFNILRDGNEDFQFNNGELIYYSGQFNCTDGFHRSMGILNALLDSPYLTLKFPVTITNFDKTKAKRMIGQEEKKNVMPKDYAKTLEDTHANSIVRELNARKGEMQGKITEDTNAIRYNLAYTTHNVLSMAIEENFKIESQRDVRKIADFLIKGFDEILGIFVEEFKNPNKNSVITENLIFVGYVAILSELYGIDNWIDNVEYILKSINFDTNNEKWNEIGIFTEHGKLSKRRVKTISRYFKDFVSEEDHKNERII